MTTDTTTLVRALWRRWWASYRPGRLPGWQRPGGAFVRLSPARVRQLAERIREEHEA